VASADNPAPSQSQITYIDLTTLLADFTETPGSGWEVHTWSDWGNDLKLIANNAALTESQRLKGIVKGLLKIICTLTVGSSTAQGFEQFWGPPNCCRLPDQQKVQGVSTPKKNYAIAKLAKIREVVAPGEPKREKKTVKVYLHKIVAWMANGNPPMPNGKVALATHHCGKKDCLGLSCMRWGTHSTNAEDSYVQDCLANNRPKKGNETARRKT